MNARRIRTARNRNLAPFVILAGVFVCTLAWADAGHTQVAAKVDTAPASAAKVWPSDPPSDWPFPKSTGITGIVFTGRHIRYANAGTWYPSWAENGNVYSPWTGFEYPERDQTNEHNASR